MEHTCVHSLTQPANLFQGWSTIHLVVNHKPWQAVSFCYWNNTSRHKETDTCYHSHWRSCLSLSVSLPHSPIIFPAFFPSLTFSHLFSTLSSPFSDCWFCGGSDFFHFLIYWMPWFKQWVCVCTRASFFHSCTETQTSCVSSMWMILVLCVFFCFAFCVCVFYNNHTEARVHHLWL